MSILKGKVALVIGGAGEVGEGVVRQFLTHGATVVVPSRDEYRIEQLRNHLGQICCDRLITFQAGCTTEEGGHDLRKKIENEVGHLDTVVASIGGWWQGEQLSQVPLRIWNHIMENSLTAHFVAAKTFLPLLADQEGSCYIFLNGGAALYAIPTAGPISITASAQLMLKNVFVAEYEQHPIRINTLLVKTKINTRSQPNPKPYWITADEVGLYTVYLASPACDLRGETIIFNERGEIPILFE
ncbi:MAG: SDR family oxidoreductase [Anaerolineaceae bacterium]|nr:SDR family oxidoreductase [Anaerolineaceae bacterium]